jgi:hypothetical protein
MEVVPSWLIFRAAAWPQPLPSVEKRPGYPAASAVGIGKLDPAEVVTITGAALKLD